jgi:pyruvate dehydrogenase E1 component alpha subunit
VAAASFEAVERARRGEGPTLIESKTYRIRGHSRSDRNRYRTKEEIDTWQGRDPIRLFEEELKNYGFISDQDIAAIRDSVDAEIAEGIAYANDSPAPSTADITRYVYTEL